MAVKDKKRTSAMDQLLQLEDEVNKARQLSVEAGSTLKRNTDEANALLDERRRLAHQDPKLVDHRGMPSGVANNPIEEIDKRLREYDLEDDHARYEHAKRLLAQAEDEVRAFIPPVFWQLVEAVTPEAEQAAEDVRAAMAEAHAAVERYIDVYRRVLGLTAPMAEVDGRDIPGLDHAAVLAKAVREIELPVPVPVRRVG